MTASAPTTIKLLIVGEIFIFLRFDYLISAFVYIFIGHNVATDLKKTLLL